MHTYTTSGTYTDVFRAFSTCDSIVTTHLNILATTQSHTICAGHSITIGTHTYTATGTYHDTLISLVYGLDSTVTTHLNVLAITQSVTVCHGHSVTVGTHTYTTSGTYQDTLASLVYGCDSTVTTHFAVLSDSISSSAQTLTLCAGQSITIGTTTYATSGNYTYHFTSGGCDSAVTTHLTVLPPYISTQSHSVCAGQHLTVGTHIYNASGTYHDTLTSYHGCDSIVTTHLTILSGSNPFSQTLTLCTGQAVTIGTATYTTTGNYTYHFTGGGCDSMVTTHLTVLPPSFIQDTIVICAGHSVTVGTHIYNATGTYRDTLISSHGCDSTVTTHLTVLYNSNSTSLQTLTICDGESLSVGKATYTTSGTYIYHFTSAGCDSAVTTHLTVNDISVTVSGASITANATPAAYQWVICGNGGNGNTMLEQQSNQSFTADTNGIYAVIIVQNGNMCTSPCHHLTTVGIAENSFATTINIYPNPFNLQTTISFSEEQKNTILKIMDVLGKEIKTINFTGKELIIEKGEMKSGIYFVQIIDMNKNVVNRKIMVQ